MSLEDLAKKAIEESNGKMFYGVGNSSRSKSALPLFIEYLQSIDSSYSMEFEWQQPKNNKIFDQLTADSLKPEGTFAMTLIQDGNQIESKMVQTGILDTFIPKEWAEANGTTADAYDGYLALQTLNKVFMYNNTGSKTYDNCWDFVAEGEHGLYMDIDSEIVGKNFLYMLTADTYAGWLKDAFNALSADEQICLINNGVLQQYDAPLTVYNRPNNLFVADFVGNPSINFVEAKGTQRADGAVELTMLGDRRAVFRPAQPLDLSGWFRARDERGALLAEEHRQKAAEKGFAEKGNKDETFRYHIAKVEEEDLSLQEEPVLTNEDLVLGIRPEFIGIAEGGALSGEIYGAMPTGMESTIKVRIGDFLLTGVVFGSTLFTIGTQVHVDVAGDNIMLFDRKSGQCVAFGSLEC